MTNNLLESPPITSDPAYNLVEIGAYDSLLPQEKIIVDVYIKTNNATEAGRQAGYAPNSARQAVYRCMQRDRVKRAVIERRKQLAIELGYTPEKIKEKIASLAESAKYDSDKLRALELLGKAQRMFADGNERAPEVTNIFAILPALPPAGTPIHTIDVNALSSIIGALGIVDNKSTPAQVPTPPQAVGIDNNTPSPKISHQNEEVSQTQHTTNDNDNANDVGSGNDGVVSEAEMAEVKGGNSGGGIGCGA